jgi:hypothetical protein
MLLNRRTDGVYGHTDIHISTDISDSLHLYRNYHIVMCLKITLKRGDLLPPTKQQFTPKICHQDFEHNLVKRWS